MQIDKLQMELRPRSPAQALDLGFALLRSRPYAAYMSYAMLMLPFVLLAAALIAAFPEYSGFFIYIPWWFKPIVERAPLYVLSRQVFGTNVSWQEAVRAWPRQLGGGAISLLTWFRFFSAGRSFFQPVWQLEHARGAVARERRRTLGANGTARSGFWFGVVCLGLELIAYAGLTYFIASLMDAADPMLGLWRSMGSERNLWFQIGSLGLFSLVMMIFGPIYTACGFTLYLNRRAALEAWDIEIKLRQITPPPAHRGAGRQSAPLAMLLGALLCGIGLAGSPDALAEPGDSKTRADCLKAQQYQRLPTSDPEQQRIRRQLDQLHGYEQLRSFECMERWVSKASAKKEEKKEETPMRDKGPDLNVLANVLQVFAIAALIGGAAWLLYHFRDHFPAFQRKRQLAVATEVGGLDIRAESLPRHITDEVRRLWQAGERRAALALLYRATLSRMVTDNGLLLRQGDTEGDCLRAANRASAEQRLPQTRLAVAVAATALWLDAAYGNRWPRDEQVSQCCDDWQRAFDTTAGSAA